MTAFTLGIAAAVAGSVLYNAGIAFQAVEARTIPSRHSLQMSLLRELVGRGRWLTGTFLGVLAWPFHAVALLLAPLTVVQPVLASGLFLLLVYGRYLLGEPVGRPELAGVTAIGAGMAGLVWAAPPRSVAHASPSTLVVTFAGLGLIALVPYLLRIFGSPLSGGVVAALSAGVAFSATGLTTKLFADAADSLLWPSLAVWLLLTGAGATIAVLSEMTALQTRPATRVAPVVFAVETAIPVLLAPLIAHERWSSTPLGGVALLISLAVLVAGIVMLTSGALLNGVPSAKTDSTAEVRPGPFSISRGLRDL